MNKLILVDGSNLLHRALHVPDVYELQYNGVRTGGVHAFFRSLMYIVKAFQDYPIVCWDKGFSERRIKLYPNYKKRENKDAQMQSGMVEPKDLEYLDEYRKQRAVISQILNQFAVPSLLLPNTEADDTIYYLTKTYAKSISFIMSEDLDYLQLLDQVDVFLPMRKVYYSWNPDNLNPSVVNYSKLYGIVLKTLKDLGYESTTQYLYAKSMKGDSSDNIPGVKGIGEVGGKKISLEMIKNPFYINDLKQKPKLGSFEKKLLEGYEDYNLALNLIDLSKEEFTEEKKADILNQISLTLKKESDIISLTGTFADYGLQKLMGNLDDYLKALMMVRPDAKKVFDGA